MPTNAIDPTTLSEITRALELFVGVVADEVVDCVVNDVVVSDDVMKDNAVNDDLVNDGCFTEFRFSRWSLEKIRFCFKNSQKCEIV